MCSEGARVYSEVARVYSEGARVYSERARVYSCIVREPEYIVREPESNYKGVGARNQWLLGVESESMTGVMGWSQSLWCKSQRL